MTSRRVLQLSRHVLPQPRIGSQRLSPQNMGDGRDRMAYLNGLVAHLGTLLRADGLELERVLRFRSQAPFAEQLTRLAIEDGRVVASAIDGAADLLGFELDRLTVVLADGRRRRPEEMLTLETGASTPQLVHVLAALAAGTPRPELLARARDQGVDMDDDFLDELLARGVIEERDEPLRPAARFAAAPGDRVTWLGHAAAMFQSGPTTLWIDPHLPPVLRWQPGEAERVLSPAFADAALMEDYGDAAEQLSVLELPVPDAVLITHPDVDHCDLGVLMTLPETTAIVVPRSRGAPWEVELARLIRDVLGEGRRVVELAHGEELRLGDVRVTAFPFVGEFPPSLPHAWNCYLVETERSLAAFTADASVTPAEVELLARRLAGGRPSLLMARIGEEDDTPSFGWRENGAELYSPLRVWPWYAPLGSWFDPTPPLGVSRVSCAALARAGLRAFFPYAVGSVPWLRFHDPAHFFWAGVGSLWRADLEAFASQIAPLGLRVPPIRYGRPLSLDEAALRA